MGVYVPNAKVPSACEWCTYPIWLSCDARNTYTDKRPTDCPLVEVKPHGRLIDADALKDVFFCTEVDGVKTHVATELVNVIIDDAPTIIEAEGEP